MDERAPDKLPRILFEIGKAIGSGRDLAAMMGQISELATELVGGDATSIMVLDPPKERLLAKAAYGLRIGNLEFVSFAVGEGVAGWVAKHGEPALIDDVSKDERFTVRADPSTVIRAMVCVPLMVRGEPVGVLTSTSKQRGAFDKTDLEMLTFVAQTIALDIENARLLKLSVTDPLTGCFNREYLQTALPQLMKSADEAGTPLSAAMVDVDHFKQINDRFGHDVGDEVLVVVTERLRAAIRSKDVLVRYGGEEFLALLPHTDIEAAREVGERMRLKMQENPVHAADQRVELRISVGVAQYRGAPETSGTFVRRADTALYSAKGRGRNRVEVAP